MNTFLKGMTTGIAVGATCAVVMMPKKNKKTMKASTGRAIKAVGSFIENFQNMID